MLKTVFLVCTFSAACQAAGGTTFNVTLDTTPLVGHSAGPFYLGLALTDGNGTGDANNSVVVGNVTFGGGTAFGGPIAFGGANGSFETGATLTDSSFVSLISESFTPGSRLSFSLQLTSNQDDGGTPDRLTIFILDSSGVALPTLAPAGDYFLGVDLTSNSFVVDVYGSDSSRAPSAGNPITFAAPALTSSTPAVTAPDLLGLTRGAASTSIAISGLVVGTVSSAASNSVPAGNVVTQSPPGGAGANAGSAVNFVISSGPVQVVPVPAQPQTISFAPISDHLGSDPPLVLQATASSGLPVSFSIVGLAATLSGNILTFSGLGKVTVEASQSGTNLYSPASVSQTFNVTLGTPLIKSVVNAASFGAGLTPNSYAAIFGNNFSSGSANGDASTSQSLLGANVTVQDSARQSFAATLWFMSFGQVNFVIPSGVAVGGATVTVKTSTGQSASFPVTIGSVAPGLFTADGSSGGAAAANTIIVAPDGSETVFANSFCISLGACSLFPIPLNSGTQVYLTLFGTGIRARSSLSGVSLTIGGTPATVTYAGPQGSYAALDQVNALVPFSLAHAGTVDLKLVVDGVTANTVKVRFQ